jgi:hypothetical protein
MPRGRKTLYFEGLIEQQHCLMMADTGSTHMFASFDFMKQSHLNFVPFKAQVALANDAYIAVLGYSDMFVTLGSLQCKHRVLIVELPSIDVALGLDFMTKHDMSLNC